MDPPGARTRHSAGRATGRPMGRLGGSAGSRGDSAGHSAGWRFDDVRHLPETDSTNRVAADLARRGAPEGVVVVADHQTAGRGRLGREWLAPAGSSLLLSVLLRPALPADALHLTTLAVALAAADACERVAGFEPGLKWPNDLVVGSRKLGGILAEVPCPGAVVVGLGLNLRWAPSPDPVLGETAVSAVDASGIPVDAASMLEGFLDGLGGRYADLLGPGGATRLLRAYRDRCVTLGRSVRVEIGGGWIKGTAVGLSAEGLLVLELEDGGTRTVSAGDVIHLRPG